MNRKKWGRVSLIAAAICTTMFMVSLCLPALNYTRDGAAESILGYPGYALLMLGWIETMSGSPGGIAWLANPTFVLATIGLAIRRFGWATMLFGLSCWLGTASFQVKTVYVDESGSSATVGSFGPGFWLWFAAMIFGGLVSIVLLLVTTGSRKLDDVESPKAGLVQA